jgi:hypothetical protein
MKAPNYIKLSKIYKREEDFSIALSKNLSLLEIGKFEDEIEVEALVGIRRADIVASGNDGTLVIENQFGKADWDHWGRLEAYARIKEANTAALIAEEFEPLMIQTCDLRNQQDRAIDWYLIRARVTEDKLHIFQTDSGPAIDIQAERTKVEYSEFWGPIREKGLFAGKPVPEGVNWITKGVKGAGIDLVVNQAETKVLYYYMGESQEERRDRAFDLLAELNIEMFKHDAPKHSKIIFPIIKKGMRHKESWDEIRSKLVEAATQIYQKISESDL